jgi:hypothetical protein
MHTRLLLQAGGLRLLSLAAVALKRRTSATPLDEQQRPAWS